MIKLLENIKEKNTFIEFIYKLYKDDPLFVDTCLFHTKSFLYKKATFMCECFSQAAQVRIGGKVLCQCILIIPKSYKSLYIAFFDALDNEFDAVNELLEYAKTVAIKEGINNIIIGVNGHISYGAGILIENARGKISFDSPYNKLYYKDYFADRFISHGLSTYCAKISEVRPKIEKFKKFIPQNLCVEKMNKKKFKSDILRFCALSNAALIRTDLYENIEEKVFLELIGEMKVLLKNENLLFLKKDGKDIGFLFWHPDYNEALKGGKKNNILSVFFSRYKKVNTIKVNAIGGDEGEQVFLPIANALKDIVCDKYKYMESNFVWDSNKTSYKTLLSAGFEECRKYCVYEWKIDV